MHGLIVKNKVSSGRYYVIYWQSTVSPTHLCGEPILETVVQTTTDTRLGERYHF